MVRLMFAEIGVLPRKAYARIKVGTQHIYCTPTYRQLFTKTSTKFYRAIFKYFSGLTGSKTKNGVAKRKNVNKGM